MTVVSQPVLAAYHAMLIERGVRVGQFFESHES